MYDQAAASRLAEKSSLHGIQVELQQGYNLSPIEAQALARRVQELVEERAGLARQAGQITYQAIAVDERPGKPLALCRRVPVQLSVFTEEDSELWAREGPEAVRRARVHRLTYEALMQDGALSQEDLACVLGMSLKTVKRIFAWYRQQDQRLPSRGEIQDMGRGVSHKIPVICHYVQELSFSRISQALGKHGISSMARYLRHFALVMILEDRGLTPAQMQSVIGISENLIGQYRQLYAELNVPEHARALERLKGSLAHPPTLPEDEPEAQPEPTAVGQKGGRP